MHAAAAFVDAILSLPSCVDLFRISSPCRAVTFVQALPDRGVAATVGVKVSLIHPDSPMTPHDSMPHRAMMHPKRGRARP